MATVPLDQDFLPRKEFGPTLWLMEAGEAGAEAEAGDSPRRLREVAAAARSRALCAREESEERRRRHEEARAALRLLRATTHAASIEAWQRCFQEAARAAAPVVLACVARGVGVACHVRARAVGEVAPQGCVSSSRASSPLRDQAEAVEAAATVAKEDVAVPRRCREVHAQRSLRLAVKRDAERKAAIAGRQLVLAEFHADREHFTARTGGRRRAVPTDGCVAGRQGAVPTPSQAALSAVAQAPQLIRAADGAGGDGGPRVKVRLPSGELLELTARGELGEVGVSSLLEVVAGALLSPPVCGSVEAMLRACALLRLDVFPPAELPDELLDRTLGQGGMAAGCVLAVLPRSGASSTPTASATVPTASPTQRRQCASGCGRVATWHSTHCCAMCASRPGCHGPLCEAVPFCREALPRRGPLPPTSLMHALLANLNAATGGGSCDESADESDDDLTGCSMPRSPLIFPPRHGLDARLPDGELKAGAAAASCEALCAAAPPGISRAAAERRSAIAAAASAVDIGVGGMLCGCHTSARPFAIDGLVLLCAEVRHGPLASL